MAPGVGRTTHGTTSNGHCAPNRRASQRETRRDAPLMTQVAAVEATGDYDYHKMLKTVARRRRVDKAKVHRALGLLARDLDLFVANFNARLKSIAQLTFHDSPDDLRVASIAKTQDRKKRGRRAGARVQRGRRNEARRGGGVEASPNPTFYPTKANEGKEEEGRRVREEEPQEPKQRRGAIRRKAGESSREERQEAQRPLPRLRREERAVGAAPAAVAVAVLQTDTAVVPVRAKRVAAVSRPRVPSPPPPSPTPVGSPRPPVAMKAAGRVVTKEKAAKKVAVKRPVAKSREDRRGLSNCCHV